MCSSDLQLHWQANSFLLTCDVDPGNTQVGYCSSVISFDALVMVSGLIALGESGAVSEGSSLTDSVPS